MSPPTLRQLCIAAAIRNVKCEWTLNKHRHFYTDLTRFLDLNDIGNIPYALARPFLLKIESPEKLVSWPLLTT